MLRATGRVVGFTDADLPFELSAPARGISEDSRRAQHEVVFGARDLGQPSTLRPPKALAHFGNLRVSTNCQAADLARSDRHPMWAEVVHQPTPPRKSSRVSRSRGFACDARGGPISPSDWASVTAAFRCASSGSISRRFRCGATTLPMLRDIVALWWRNRNGLPGWPQWENHPGM